MPPIPAFTEPPSPPGPKCVWKMLIQSDETGTGWFGWLFHAGRIVIQTDLACTPNQVASELLASQCAFEDGELDLDEALDAYDHTPAPTQESATA